MFSPNMVYLISLGDANDRGLFVWEWLTETRVTSNKLGKPVNTFAFSHHNSFFVTAGYQHLKYWYFDQDGIVQKSVAQGAGNVTESIMESKSADLNKVKVKIFVGVQCVANGGQSGKEEQVLALATDGHLYVYDKNRKLTKWMNIKVDRALSCVLGGDHLYCACNDGIVRIFSSKSLEHIMTLPKPPPLGQAHVESGNKKIRIPSSKDSRFADALAILVDEKNNRIVVLYSDKMIFIWDISKMDKISVYRTLYSHSGPIYDLQYIPNNLPIGIQNIDSNNPDENLTDDEMTHISKFATCSADRTIRFWNFVDPSGSIKSEKLNKVLVRNAYCKDMSKMIYVSNYDPRGDPSNSNQNPQNQYEQFKVRPISLNEDGTAKIDSNLTSTQFQRELEQLRCIKISPDGKHLACGDWTGNIRIHDLSNTNTTLYSTYNEIQCIQAHESEVVCLDYSPINVTSYDRGNPHLGDEPAIKYWLASCSRDRLTHIYECIPKDIDPTPYKNVSIIDDHSSTITSIKFAEEKNAVDKKRRLKLISSGADKQIVIRNILPSGTAFAYTMSGQGGGDFSNEDGIQTQLLKKEQCKHKVLSMDVSGGYGISGHDKYVQLWQITTPQSTGFDRVWDRKVDSQKKSSVLDHLRVVFGPTTQSGLGHPQQPGCEIIIASCADKTVTLYETVTGNALCKTTCGEVTTSMCLSTNLKHLITTSMDGIIYIWKLPEPLTKALLKIRSECPLQSTMKLKTKAGSSLAAAEGVQEEQPQAQLNTSQEFDFKLDDAEVQINSNQQQTAAVEQTNINDESSMMDNYQAQPAPSLSMIMKQISKVTTQIEKIQPLRNRGANNYAQTQALENLEDQLAPSQNILPEFSSSAPQNDSSDQTLQPHPFKRRNAWGASSKSPRGGEVPLPQQVDTSPVIEEDENPTPLPETIRPLQIKENKLPRWAQSVAGVDPGKNPEKILPECDPFAFNNQQQLIQDSEIEDIFANNIEQLNKPPGVKKALFYNKIDEEEEEEERKSQKPSQNAQMSSLGPGGGADPPQKFEEEDPYENLVQEQLRMRNQQHKPMLGLDESDESGEEGGCSQRHSQRNRMLLRRASENRQSQSTIFLQRKQQQIENPQSIDLKKPQIERHHQNKAEDLEVEDIFNEDVQESHKEQLKIVEDQNNRYKRMLNTLNSENNDEDQEEEKKQSIIPQLNLQQQPMIIDESIIMSERSIVKVKEGKKEEETEINSVLREEIEKINQSLAKINKCLEATKVSDSQASSITVNVKEDVCESLSQSINLWNNLALTLGTKPVPFPTISESNAHFQSPGKASTMPPMKMGGQGSQLSSIAPSGAFVNQTLSQSISIKEDAHDLLERYSDLLLAEILRKINKKQ